MARLQEGKRAKLTGVLVMSLSIPSCPDDFSPQAQTLEREMRGHDRAWQERVFAESRKRGEVARYLPALVRHTV